MRQFLAVQTLNVQKLNWILKLKPVCGEGSVNYATCAFNKQNKTFRLKTTIHD